MKYIFSLIIGGALVVSGFGQTRNVLVGTNNAVVQPTNFWSADASNARSGLGLGSAATNPASAFQPSSSNLSNVAANDGVGLTNLNATNLVGTLSVSKGGTGSTNASDARLSLGLGTASTNPATAFQPSSAALSNLASSNGGILTNLQAENLVGIIPASNISTVNFTNIAGTLSIASGGTGATNIANARQNLGSTTVGDAIFTASNAVAARATLSLGTASTSDITSFQPANANLTNLSTNNGSSLSGISISGIVNLQSNLDTKLAINGNASGLTNITAANINGTVALASNITGIVSISNGGTGTNTASGARASLGATTIGAGLFTLANPSSVRFIRLNADNTVSSLSDSDFRTAIGLGTASTNPATAFQPADSDLNALASNNGGSLTNLQSTSIVGIIPASNISTVNFSNLGGTLAISSGGTGATNAGGARTNLSLGWSALTNTNSATSLLGHTTNGTVVYTGPDYLAFTNSDVIFNRLTIGNLLFMGDASGLFIDGDASIFLGTALTKSNFRNELGLGWSALTNTNAANFRTNIGLGTNNQAQFQSILLGVNGTIQAPTGGSISLESCTFPTINVGSFGQLSTAFNGTNYFMRVRGPNSNVIEAFDAVVNFLAPISFNDPYAAQTRTNLGLGWPALTNTNAAGFNASLYGSGTNPVLYNTNGDVVSPTNFWQQAPIATTVAFSAPVTNSTNTATNSRNLIIQSLSSNIVSTTNTLLLPTNTATFNGDTAVVIHAGGSGSATAIRQAGQTSDLIVLTNFDHAVRFLYFNNTWDFYHNLAYVEPIYFSGTNALANAAASRTNLGLVWSGLTNTNDVTFQTALFSTNRNLYGDTGIVEVSWDSGQLSLVGPISWPYLGGATAVAQTRTNLGLPLPALTNTNNANFQAAVFATNSNPTNAGNFNNHVAWMEVTVQTNGSNVSFRVPLYK